MSAMIAGVVGTAPAAAATAPAAPPAPEPQIQSQGLMELLAAQARRAPHAVCPAVPATLHPPPATLHLDFAEGRRWAEAA